MSYFGNIQEEELKAKVGEVFFADFDHTQILGKVDFTVAEKLPATQPTLDFYDQEFFLWAEAKRARQDLLEAFTQLILTIGKERTFDHHLPPKFLGAFDADAIGFVPYSAVMEVFYQNDFNWNVTPSDHATKEFRQLHDLLEESFQKNSLKFNYLTDKEELIRFIKANFRSDRQDVSRLRVTKNNFVNIYLKWCATVKDTIDIDWGLAKKNAILDADFYLADLLSKDDFTLKDKLNVVLHARQYELNRHLDAMGLLNSSQVAFKDDGARHLAFWNRYVRPPKREYWDYILARRDLLIPQDVRERKGSFFTPAKWVAKAQEYLAEALGENWQDEYTVWDCCAGTGNLLAGLVNKYNVWASTLDKSDVDVMLDRIDHGANLLPNHVFQFDFLNGDFADLPQDLRNVIQDPEKRKKLVVFINPPYAEAGDAKQATGTGKNKAKVATEHKTYIAAKPQISAAALELFAQFFYRIYKEIDGCILASFSTLKHLQGQNFRKFREFFLARLLKTFVVPASTFDNVNGKFPIGFLIWNTAIKEQFSIATADVFSSQDEFIGHKQIKAINNLCINWIKQFYDSTQIKLAFFRTNGSDVQNNIGVFLTLKLSKNDEIKHFYMQITAKNIIPFSIYFTARKIIEDT